MELESSSRPGSLEQSDVSVKGEDKKTCFFFLRTTDYHLKVGISDSTIMYLAIKDVKPLQDYKLLLTFENGEHRIFDMTPYLEKGIFKELKDIKLFNTVRVSFDTIEWANEADFDPEILYELSVKVDQVESPE